MRRNDPTPFRFGPTERRQEQNFPILRAITRFAWLILALAIGRTVWSLVGPYVRTFF